MAGYIIVDEETTSQEVFLYPVTLRGATANFVIPFRHLINRHTARMRVTGLTHAQAKTEAANQVNLLRRQVTRYVITQAEGGDVEVQEVTAEEQCGDVRIRPVGGGLWEMEYSDTTTTETANLVWGEETP